MAIATGNGRVAENWKGWVAMTQDETIRRLARAFQRWLEGDREALQKEETVTLATEEQIAQALDLATRGWSRRPSLKRKNADANRRSDDDKLNASNDK